MKDLRPAIIRAHNRGKKQNEIADFLGISQGTVSKAIVVGPELDMGSKHRCFLFQPAPVSTAKFIENS